MIVKADWPVGVDGNQVMVADHQDIRNTDGMKAAAALVTRNGAICPMRLMNMSTRPRVIRKGEQIGGAEEVEAMPYSSDRLLSPKALPHT
jgi:hypothetical protein